MLSEDETIKNLRKLEADIHRGGWDQPRIFAEVRYVSPNVTQLWRMPITFGDGKVGAYLMGLGEHLMQHPDLIHELFPRGLNNLLGLLLCDEGWGVSEDKHIPGVAHADNPHGEEVRFVILMDLHGRIFKADRARGRKPHAYRMDTTAYGDKLFANIPQALVRILLVAAKQLPDGHADMQALQAIYRPLPDHGATRPQASNAT